MPMFGFGFGLGRKVLAGGGGPASTGDLQVDGFPVLVDSFAIVFS